MSACGYMRMSEIFQRSEEDMNTWTRIRLRVTQFGYQEPNIGPLQKQYVFLTAENVPAPKY